MGYSPWGHKELDMTGQACMLGDVGSMGVDKCIMTCVHHYSII